MRKGCMAVIRMPVGGKRKAENPVSQQKAEGRAKRRARWLSEAEKTQRTKVDSPTVTKVDSPVGFCRAGQHHNMLGALWRTVFEMDKKYIPIKRIGEGAYGIVCSATNTRTGEKVAIKKVAHAFSHPEEAKRMLREIVLLRHLVHDNIIPIKDIMKPVAKHGEETFVPGQGLSGSTRVDHQHPWVAGRQ
jgi:Protein kinase domain